jgi:hypothetical protein
MRTAFPLLLVLSICVLPATAQVPSPKAPPSGSPPAANQAAIPFSVGGFTHRLIPPRTHMFDCSQPFCGAGSKVSYIFYAPKPGMTFDDYKASREMIEAAIKSRLPVGTSIKVMPSTQSQDKLFTIFESRRIVTAPDGSAQVTVSRTLVKSTVGIDLISSGSDEKLAASNLALFTLAAMLVASASAPTKP